MKKIKGKIVNYWYYYKWHTLIVLFFAVVFTVLIVQMVSRPKYDIKILYAGPAIISDEQSKAICEAFSQLMPTDYDGNGEKNAELFSLIIMDDEQLKEANETYSDYFLNRGTINDNRETLTMNTLAGDYIIYLIDINCYADLRDNSAFAKREDYGFDAGTPYDEYAVYLNSLDFAEFYTAFDVFPDSTLVCIKRVQVNEDGDGKLVEAQQNHIDFLKSAAAFKAPAEQETE